jgi:phosphotransacetylase
VALVREGQAELLMKGSLHYRRAAGAVVARETGLRTGRRLSHVFVMDRARPTTRSSSSPTRAINIAPDARGQGRHLPERHRPGALVGVERRRWRSSPRSKR